MLPRGLILPVFVCVMLLLLAGVRLLIGANETRTIGNADDQVTAILPNSDGASVWYTTEIGLYAIGIDTGNIETIYKNTPELTVLDSRISALDNVFTIRKKSNDGYIYQINDGRDHDAIAKKEFCDKVDVAKRVGIIAWNGFDEKAERKYIALTDMSGTVITDLSDSKYWRIFVAEAKKLS